ncbi:16504_t:CDS:2, partial [Gigaspora margarita]
GEHLPNEKKLIDYHGYRPKTDARITPQLFIQLFKRCWDAKPENRPMSQELMYQFDKWFGILNTEAEYDEFWKQVEKIEEQRKSGAIPNSPTFFESRINYTTHPQAIYSSRLFNFPAFPLAKNAESTSVKGFGSNPVAKTSGWSAVLLINETGINMTADELRKERHEKNLKRFPFAKPMPGAMRLVKHLKKHRIPIAVATSSSRESFNIKASNNRELFDLFDNIICGDDANVKNGKPAPDIFLAAREGIGNPLTNQCLVFEDSIIGIKAAKNANMNVIWVPDPMIAELYPGKNGADEMIFSLNDFDPTKFGLPPFDEESDSGEFTLYEINETKVLIVIDKIISQELHSPKGYTN